MKHFLWVLLLSGSLTPALSQTQLFVGVGFQAGFDNMPNANVPVDRYNGTAFHYKPMNRFHWPMGEIYAVSIRSGRGMVELNLNTRRQRATTKNTNSTGIHQQDVRFSMQALSLGTGYAAVDQDAFVLYLGAALDGGYMRLLVRSGPESQISRVNYQLLRRLPMLAGSIFLKMVFRNSRESLSVFSISPYLHVPFRQFDFLPMDQYLNQGGFIPILTTPLPARPINVGVALNFDLDLLGFLDN